MRNPDAKPERHLEDQLSGTLLVPSLLVNDSDDLGDVQLSSSTGRTAPWKNWKNGALHPRLFAPAGTSQSLLAGKAAPPANARHTVDPLSVGLQEPQT